MTQSWYQLDWIWTTTGYLLATLALTLLLWSLFHDRPRGRRRCPKCWYDMSGITGLRCPECGREFPAERKLHRTRRKWGWVPLALLLLAAAYPAAHVPRILRFGWPGAMPTTALIEWVARYEPPEVYANRKMSAPTAIAAELGRRASAGELWGWQWRFMIRRLHILRWRERWPVGRAWEVTFSRPNWLMQPGTRLEIDMPSNMSYLPSYPPGATEHITRLVPIGLPTKTNMLPEGADSIVVNVSAPGWKGPMTLGVKQVPRVEDAITPVSNAAIDGQVRRALQASISPDQNSKTATNLMLGARLYRDKGPISTDLAVGLTVELRRDGDLVKAWPLRMIDSAYGSPVDWIRVEMPAPGWIQSDPDDMKRWTVRIRGDPAIALGDASRERCWAGEYTMPLTEFQR